MREANLIKFIRDQIPSFDCIPGCTDCCGVKPLSKVESEKLGMAVGELTNIPGSPKCKFASASGCDVYDERPIPCRMFGAYDDKRLACPHGRGPAKKMGMGKANELIKKYNVFVIIDESKINVGQREVLAAQAAEEASRNAV